MKLFSFNREIEGSLKRYEQLVWMGFNDNEAFAISKKYKSIQECIDHLSTNDNDQYELKITPGNDISMNSAMSLYQKLQRNKKFMDSSYKKMWSIKKTDADKTINILSKEASILTDITGNYKKIKPLSIKIISEHIDKIYQWFFGDFGAESNPNNIHKVTEYIIYSPDNLFLKLVKTMKYFDFTATKQTAQILREIIKNYDKNQCHIYIQSITDQTGYNPLIQCLFDKYDQNHGGILHEMACCSELKNMLLNNINIKRKNRSIPDYKHDEDKEEEKEDKLGFGFVDQLLLLINSPDLIKSDAAFETLQYLLTNNDKYVDQYLERNFDDLFNEINGIIKYMDNVFMKKKLLRLLFEIISNENNYDMMMEYIQNKQYLILYMDLIKKYEKSSVWWQAWHLFKLFVWNKNKSKDIESVLLNNKDDLIAFLKGFQCDKVENKQFRVEKNMVINYLSDSE